MSTSNPNPNKPLRTAFISALKVAGNVEVWSKLVPRNVKPIPDQYILITTQTKTRVAVAKPTDQLYDNFNWLVSTTIDMYNFSPAGYSNPGKNDDLEELITLAIENILVPGWAIKSRIFVQSLDLDVNTTENFIERRVITYQHWIEKL